MRDDTEILMSMFLYFPDNVDAVGDGDVLLKWHRRQTVARQVEGDDVLLLSVEVLGK